MGAHRRYLILDHMLDLSFHRDDEKDTKVEDKNGIVDTDSVLGKEMEYGTSKKENQVHTNATAVARVAECQNLNSGNLSSIPPSVWFYRRIKGRNSSSCFVGRFPDVPSSDS
jgi:hypothetical protein